MARMREKAVRTPRATTSFPTHTTSTTLAPSKRDKRQIKHSLLLSRVKKSTSSTNAKKALRRNRRKSAPAAQQQLTANLSSLIDALPPATLAAEAGGNVSASANASQVKAVLTGGKSIASRPGSQKRREAVSRAERERFSRNLAAMAGKREEVVAAQGEVQEMELSKHAGAGGDESGNRADRWAALRNHIQQSMASQTSG